MYSSKLFLESFIIFYLEADVFVNNFIFLFIKISDKSYFVYLNISIQKVIIFNFLYIFAFYSMYLRRFLIRSSYEFLFRISLYRFIEFYRKGERKLFYSKFVYLIYLRSLSYLKKLPMKLSRFIFLYFVSLIINFYRKNQTYYLKI
jgi:hypothetical protein